MQKRYSLFGLLLLIVFQTFSLVHAQCSCSTLSTPKEDFGSVVLLRDVVNWHSYTFGGRNAAGTVISGCEARVMNNLGVIGCFSPVASFSLPAGPRAEMSVVYFQPNGKVYLFGGTDGSTDYADVWELDPLTYTWTAKAPMSMERSATGVMALDNKIYVVGGKRSSAVLDLLEEYDPFTDTWTTKAPMSSPRYALEFHPGTPVAHSMVLSHGYAMGGIDGSGIVTNLNEAYDPVTDSWTAVAPMPVALAWFGAFQTNGTYSSATVDIYRIGVIGGQNAAGAAVSSAYQYQPAANTWISPSPWGTPALCTPVSHHEAFMTGVTGADPIFVVYTLGGREAGPTVRDLIRFHGGSAVMAEDGITLQGNWVDDAVNLQWQMEGAHRVDRFVVEGEVNSGEFADLNLSQQCSGTCGGSQHFIRLDQAQSGHLNYRVTAVLMDGTVLQSNVVRVSSELDQAISFWVQDGILHMNCAPAFMQDVAQVRILSLEGRVMLQGEKPAQQSTWSMDCSGLSRGMYLVECRSEKGVVTTKFLR